MNTLYTKLSNDWREHFMLYASSAIIVSTCLGAITVMSIFQNGNNLMQMIQVFLVVVLCNAVLASILTVQKPKIVLNAVIASLGACLILMLVNFLI